MANTQKQSYVSSLVESMGTTPQFVLLNFGSLTHHNLEELRGKLRELHVESFKVVKNSLLWVALKKVKRDLSESETATFEEALKGPTALLLLNENWTDVLKALQTFSKEHDGLTFKAGFIENTAYTADGVLQLSKLPSKMELYAKILGAMKAPQTRIVYSMNFTMSKFTRVLHGIQEKQAES